MIWFWMRNVQEMSLKPLRFEIAEGSDPQALQVVDCFSLDLAISTCTCTLHLYLTDPKSRCLSDHCIAWIGSWTPVITYNLVKMCELRQDVSLAGKLVILLGNN